MDKSYINKYSKTCNARITSDWGAFTFVAVEKQEVLNILKVCLYSCLRYPRPNRIVSTPFYVNRGLFGPTTLLHISKMASFFFLGGEGGYWTQNLFWCSLQLLVGIVLIPKRIRRDIIINEQRSSWIVLVILIRFKKLEFSLQTFQ